MCHNSSIWAACGDEKREGPSITIFMSTMTKFVVQHVTCTPCGGGKCNFFSHGQSYSSLPTTWALMCNFLFVRNSTVMMMMIYTRLSCFLIFFAKIAAAE